MREVRERDPALTSILGGALHLRQPNRGHRVGTDALLLAASIIPIEGERVVDVGSGVGSVGLAIALRHPTVSVHLLEIVPEIADLARANVALGGFGERVSVETGDLFHSRTVAAVGRGGWVVSNPPYYHASERRPSPDPWKNRAHQLAPGFDHADWLMAMFRFVAPRGRIAVIHRPEALPKLLGAAEGRLGDIHVRPIHSRADQPAMRVLFAGRVGSRAPLRLLPPLVLHGEGEGFLPLAEAMHRNEALLGLF